MELKVSLIPFRIVFHEEEKQIKADTIKRT